MSDESDIEVLENLPEFCHDISSSASSSSSSDETSDSSSDEESTQDQNGTNVIEQYVKRNYEFHNRRVIERADTMSERDFRTMFRLTRGKAYNWLDLLTFMNREHLDYYT